MITAHLNILPFLRKRYYATSYFLLIQDNDKKGYLMSNTTATIKTSSWFAWLICGLGALFYCYEYFLRISPSVMATDLRLAFHLDAASFGNLAAFYYYAYTPMQIPVGVMMDHYGPRRLLIFACVACAVGTYLFAQHNHLFIAQLGRFLVGFGSAFAFVGVLKLATIWLPPNRFAMISGITTSLGMLGAMGGDIALAALIKIEGWYNTLLISTIGGVVLAIIIALIMPSTTDKLNKSNESTASDLKNLFKELLILLRNPYFWLNGLIGCLLYLSLSAFGELWAPSYLEAVYHYSQTDAAHAVSMIFLGWALGGPFAGWISDKLRRRLLPLMICSILAAIVIGLVIYVPGIPKALLFSLMFLFGLFSSAQIIVFAIGREVSPPQIAGTAIAFTNMLVMIGGVIFQPIIGILLEKHWDGQIVNQVHIYSMADYQFALAAIPLGALLSFIILLFMKETGTKSINK